MDWSIVWKRVLEDAVSAMGRAPLVADIGTVA
jgi:hypothetical protein